MTAQAEDRAVPVAATTHVRCFGDVEPATSSNGGLVVVGRTADDPEVPFGPSRFSGCLQSAERPKGRGTQQGDFIELNATKKQTIIVSGASSRVPGYRRACSAV
jgi:hypothetical protein